MLESISWTKFLEAAAIAFGCYYTGLALAVYRKQIIVFINDPKSIGARGKDKAADNDMPKQSASPMAIIHELSSVFEQAGYQAEKTALLDHIKTILKKYKNIDLPAYRVPVQDYIISKAEEVCGVRITAEELEGGK